MRFRSCKTEEEWSAEDFQQHRHKLTCNACEQLLCEMLDLAARKWNKRVALEEIKNALTEEVCDDANVVPKVKAVTQMNTLVAVLTVVVRKRLQHTQFNSRGVSIFLNGTDDLDGTPRFLLPIICFHDFAKSSLAQQTNSFV